MAMCKDCVHVDVCREYVMGLAAVRGVELNEAEIEQVFVSDDCEDFKDRPMFLKLPCKLGDEVFYFDTAGQIYTSKITQFIYGTTGLLLDSDVMFESSLIGKRFFFTREAAEQALKEREKNENV